MMVKYGGWECYNWGMSEKLQIIPENFSAKVSLGEKAKIPLFVKRVDKVASQVLDRKVLGVEPEKREDKKLVDIRAADIVEKLTGKNFKANSVEELENTINDPSKSKRQKEIADERLDILGKGVFMAMRYCEDEEMVDILGAGSVEAIENILPDPFKGLGERVRKNIIDTPEIVRIIDELDDVRENLDLRSSVDKKLLLEELSEANANLARTKGLSKDGKEQMRMVRAYLQTEMLDLSESLEVDNTEVEDRAIVEELRLAREGEEERAKIAADMMRKQEDLAARNLKISTEAENTTYNTWLATVVGKGGQTALPSAIWTIEPPKYFHGTGTEWNDFLDTVTSWSNKTLSRRALLGAKGDIGKAYFDANFPQISEREFTLNYNDNRTGLARALEVVASNLYVEAVTEANGTVRPARTGENGYFTMGYNISGVPDLAGAAIMAARNKGGRREFVIRMAEKLVDDGTVSSKDQSLMMISLALDFLELGFGIDGPDHQRKCNFAVEGARTKCRPGFKLGDKTAGGEVFSGSWTAFFQERYEPEISVAVLAEKRRVMSTGGVWDEEVERDAKNMILAERAKLDGLIPQVLCGSILDEEYPTVLNDQNGDPVKMKIGRALQAGIKLRPSEVSTENMLFKTNKWFENASSFWDLISGATKLDFKGGIREVDSVITDFGKEVNNSYNDLKGRGVVDINNLIGAIGGAAGLIPSDPMILNVPTGKEMTYAFVGASLLNHMPALTQSEREKIEKTFAFNEDFARGVKSLWEGSHDHRLTKKERDFYRDVMQNRGSPNSAAQKHRRRMKG